MAPTTMEKSGNAFAVSKSMGHADLTSMEPYQHQELEPLRIAINKRRRKKFGQVLETYRRGKRTGNDKCLKYLGRRWWTR